MPAAVLTVFLSLLLISLSARGLAEEHGQAAPSVHFETSCAPALSAKFDRGVTMLHSFEYPETTRIFAELIEAEPGCAMAYWGAAMSIWHPLWAPPAAAEMARGRALLETAQGLDATPRESAYLAALAAYFADDAPDTLQSRVRAYADGMSRVYRSYYASDPESAVFYALALLSAADPLDRAYGSQFKAAGLLNWIRESQPRHPGVLHYTIHAYDFPGLAHLGLSAAEAYAEAAPDSAHAQHMPSHIFTRLGLWEQSLASNHDSTRSAETFTKKAHLPGHYDEGLHSMDYLMYALLQTARDDEAAGLLERLKDIDRTDTENFKVAYTYASSPARYALERKAWGEAARLELLRPDFPWHDFGFAVAVHHFARGVGAARSGEIAAARDEIAALRALEERMPATTPPYWRAQLQVQVDAVSALVQVAEGRVDKALALAKGAADREDSVDKHPVTPGEIVPARELYAELLLEAGEPERALQEFEAVLRKAPNRLNALLGAAAAAGDGGATEVGEYYRARASAQVAHGSGSRAAAVRAAMASTGSRER